MKKAIAIFSIFYLLFSTQHCCAQQAFISKGKIEFEKKVNLHKMMEASSDGTSEDAWIATIKKTIPVQKSFYFDLFFNGNKTLYKPGREDESVQKIPDWVIGTANENIVSIDLETKKSISKKVIFSDTYQIEDSIRNIKWRLTSDFRTIAGFECRKATGIIMDSVYVFAFYTDQILTTGGPESFTGLPGMILGIAIPRLNTTWFATKLELQEVTTQQLIIPPSKKVKAASNKTLATQLQSTMKDWGKSKEQLIWRIML